MDRGQCHAALCVAMRIAFARVRWRDGIGSLEGRLRIPLFLVGREVYEIVKVHGDSPRSIICDDVKVVVEY